MSLLWGAQGFIVNGATKCGDKPFLHDHSAIPWSVFGIQGFVAAVHWAGMVRLNMLWHRAEKREEKGKSPESDVEGGSGSGSGGVLGGGTNSSDGGNGTEEEGMELQELEGERQAGKLAEREGRPSSEALPRCAEEHSESDESGTRQDRGIASAIRRFESDRHRFLLPTDPASAHKAHGRLISDVTTEDCSDRIRVLLRGPISGNGEGSSRDGEMRGGLSGEEARYQGYPVPPTSDTAVISNETMRSPRKSFPREDSGVALGAREEGKKLVYRFEADDDETLTPPVTSVPEYVAEGKKGMSRDSLALRRC